MRGKRSVQLGNSPVKVTLWRSLLLFWMVVLVTTTLLGQTNQGSIAGNVLDPTGALVPNAKITATNKGTGAVYETVSTSAGSYRFSNLNIGTYEVKATAAGFKESLATGVLVQVGTTAVVQMKMETGGATATVQVLGDSPTVEAESSDVGTIVTQKQTLDLPLALGSTVQSMRSPEAFVFLAPGVVGPGTGNGNGGTFESKISGGQNFATEVLLDGVGTSRSENGSSFDETAPSVEALGEFRLITSTLPAQYGRTTGGIESFSTKGGTNQYHGKAYEIFLNEDLDANSWGNNYLLATTTDPVIHANAQRPPDKKNDFGVVLGGPVWIPKLYNGHDKTFFFYSWEQFRQNIGGSTTTTVPTPAELGGDFSALLNTSNVLGTNPCDGTPIYQGQIFDPATTKTVGGVECRTAFPGNVIPGNRFSTVGQNILSYYPSPTLSGLANNEIFAYSFPIIDTTQTFRIDQNLGTNDKAYFTYNSRDNSRLSTNPEWNNVAGQGRNQYFSTHFMRFAEDHTFSPTLLNHFTIGYNRTNSKNVGAGIRFGAQNWTGSLGIQGPVSGPVFPAISPGEAGLAGFGDTVYGDTIDNGFRLDDFVTKSTGRHTIQFGFSWWYQPYSPINFGNTSGSFNFGRGQTAGTPNTSDLSGNGIASILLGELGSANWAVYASQPKYTSNYWAGYVQDNFKLRPTLTLQLGLRYEVDQPRREVHGDTSNINIWQPNPGAGGLPGVLEFAGSGTGRNGNLKERWADTWLKDIGPRIGFAWSPARFNGKMVVRGGYGIIYGGLQYADFGGFNRTGFQTNAFANSPNGFDPALQLDTGTLPPSPPLPNLDPTQLNFSGPQYVAPSFGRPPMIQNWSLEVQHEIATDLILNVAYVGSKSQDLRTNYNSINSLSTKYFGLGNLLFAPISSPEAAAAGINPPYPGFPGNLIVAQALVPMPQYFGFNTDGELENYGMSSFHALEVQLNRRFHNGLNLMASYTWSKTLTNADSALPFFATLAGGGSPQDPDNHHNDKSISNQDIPHNFVVSYIYELPFGRNKKFLNSSGALDRVVGGWSFSGVQRYESGQPLAFGCATGVPAFSGCIRWDRVTGESLFSTQWTGGNFNPATDPMFNAAALSNPNSQALVAARGFSLGDLPRVTSEVRMPAYKDEDFNLLKRTQLTETSDLLFQVSVLNAFNRHIWNRPNLNPFDPNFGRIDVFTYSTTGGGGYLVAPRKIQLQLKFEF